MRLKPIGWPQNTACGFIGLVLAGFLGAADWPCFRGPGGQGISAESNLPLEWSASTNVHWKTAIPGLGWSSPIVAGGRVFVTTATEGGVSLRLLCLDRRTGVIAWERELFRQTLTRKESKNSYASPTPITDGERIYVMSFNGALAAVSVSGVPVWTNADFRFYGQHGPGASPLLHGDLLIVAYDGTSDGADKLLGWQKPWDQAFILAVDKYSGKISWKAGRGMSRNAHVTPNVVVVGGKSQLVSSGGDVIQGFDLETGARIWTARNPGEGVVPSVVAGDGLVFATSGFGDPAIRAFRLGGSGDITDTHLAWEQKKAVPMIPSMLYVGGHLFALTEKGILSCIKGRTGEIVWQERLAGSYSASPVYAAGRLYLLSEEGETTVIEAGPSFKVLARNPIDETCQASMAVSGGQLFIRSDRHLFCIGKP